MQIYIVLMHSEIYLSIFMFLPQKYKNEGHDTIILAGAEYGSGSSRDWAAKGPMLQVTSIPSQFLQQRSLISY